MKKIFYLFAMTGLLSCMMIGCSEEELTAQIDVQPEYEQKLALNENSTHADSLIYQWYKDYGTAVLYDFEEKDFRWLWASTYNNYYEKFDMTNSEDSDALETTLYYIEKKLFAYYDSAFLAQNLPYKIFVVKELHKGYSKSSSYENALHNSQDAMMVGYMKSESRSYSSSNFESNLATVFTEIFFDRLPQKPTAFLNSAVAVKFNLMSWPTDADINKYVNSAPYPDFLDKSVMVDRMAHIAYCVGHVHGKGGSTSIEPSQGQDYADMLSFVKNNTGSYIRQRTQYRYYWRLAMRAGLLIDFCNTVLGEDLIAEQNANYPDDKVTLEDFNYVAE